MALNIRDPDVQSLAREVAEATGETMTQAVKMALRERLARVRAVADAERERPLRAILEWVKASRRAPLVDPRSPEEILDHDENGLPR